MKNERGSLGRLLLVPAPLDFGCDVVTEVRDSMPDATLRAAAALTHWVCENAKTARAYLKRIDAVHPLCASLQAMQIQELPREVHKKEITAVASTPAPCSLRLCEVMTSGS